MRQFLIFTCTLLLSMTFLQLVGAYSGQNEKINHEDPNLKKKKGWCSTKVILDLGKGETKIITIKQLR